jgi:hypothetical protein
MLNHENGMWRIKPNTKKINKPKKHASLEKSPSWILVKYVEIYFPTDPAFISSSAKSYNFFKKKQPK